MVKSISFEIGQVVRLKSGGPGMTVSGMSDKGSVQFACQTKTGELIIGEVSPEMLMPVEVQEEKKTVN